MTKSLSKLDTTGQFLLYQTEDGLTKLEVKLVDETVWLTQLAMAELFQTTKQNVSLHLKNIFEDNELAEDRVVKDYLTTAVDGKNYQTKFYNLEAIIAVGYRVHSKRGTQFRRWATERLNEYLVKGFTMDDERLKQVSNIGSDYFDEMLERIRVKGWMCFFNSTSLKLAKNEVRNRCHKINHLHLLPNHYFQ